MHRQLLDISNSKVQVDHINHNTLDNRRYNLRIVSGRQNVLNQRCLNPNKSSKYKGVCYRSDSKKYRARIRVNNKLIELGNYDHEIEAAHIYNEAAKKHFKQYAYVNVIT